MVHARGQTPRLIDHPLLTMARPAVGPRRGSRFRTG